MFERTIRCLVIFNHDDYPEAPDSLTRSCSRLQMPRYRVPRLALLSMNTPGKDRGELRATPITDQSCSTKASAAARPIPFDAQVITMNFVINAIPLTCKFHRGEETEHHSHARSFLKSTFTAPNILHAASVLSGSITLRPASISPGPLPRRLRPRAHSPLLGRCAPSTVE
jgi:hypothetical protein